MQDVRNAAGQLACGSRGQKLPKRPIVNNNIFDDLKKNLYICKETTRHSMYRLVH